MYRCTRPGTCLPPGRYSSCSRGRQPCAPTQVPACSISIGSWARGKGPGGPWDRLAVVEACAKPEHERTDAAALDELLCPESEGRYQSDANTSDDHGSWGQHSFERAHVPRGAAEGSGSGPPGTLLAGLFACPLPFASFQRARSCGRIRRVRRAYGDVLARSLTHLLRGADVGALRLPSPN